MARNICGRLHNQWQNPADDTSGSLPSLSRFDCSTCGNTGFATPGTGYGDVCPDCGGQSAYERPDESD
jgi:membrane protease subunit (stomatin/prohibitin family)